MEGGSLRNVPCGSHSSPWTQELLSDQLLPFPSDHIDAGLLRVTWCVRRQGTSLWIGWRWPLESEVGYQAISAELREAAGSLRSACWSSLFRARPDVPAERLPSHHSSVGSPGQLSLYYVTVPFTPLLLSPSLSHLLFSLHPAPLSFSSPPLCPYNLSSTTLLFSLFFLFLHVSSMCPSLLSISFSFLLSFYTSIIHLSILEEGSFLCCSSWHFYLFFFFYLVRFFFLMAFVYSNRGSKESGCCIAI